MYLKLQSEHTPEYKVMGEVTVEQNGQVVSILTIIAKVEPV